MNEFARPNLAELSPIAARYVRGLGLDRIPAHTWTREAVDMKLVAEVAGELGGQGNRLRKPRFEALVTKLADAGIYLKFHTGKKNYGEFAVPLSIQDESPGMDSTVKVSFHPGGYNGERSTAENVIRREPSEPPARRPSEPSAGDLHVPGLKPLSQLTSEADETQEAIEALAEAPTDINLRRLLHKLVRLQKLLRLIAPAVDGTVVAFTEALRAPSCRLEEPFHVTLWPADSLTPEGFDGALETRINANSSYTQRPMGALSQLFDDEDDTDDQEENDQP